MRRRRMRGVSIHAPARGATPKPLLTWQSRRSFQSTRPHGARQGFFRDVPNPPVFQSTRPHGARPLSFPFQPTAKVFQSTRPHGARLARFTGRKIHAMFQSTRPHGARPVAVCQRPVYQSVSIHAPARGATADAKAQCDRFVKVSIHAPARGATPFYMVSFPTEGFQSTRPHGARPLTFDTACLGV